MNQASDRSSTAPLVPDHPRMAQALKDYLAALERGERPDPRAFAERFPELGTELADHLMGLEFIQRAATALRPSDSGISPPLLVTQTLGDFHILREVGRGGMGVVYEAVQLSLGRRVALKILAHTGDLDEKRLKRFKNEVLAAAQLHHANIAPVYAVGCESGLHYFAMQFIEGQTLAAVVSVLRDKVACDQCSRTGGNAQTATLVHNSPDDVLQSGAAGDTPCPDPSASTGPEQNAPAVELLNQYCLHRRAYYRTVARIGIEAALALEHAHQLGVIHRDIKPGNLMLDHAGHLWVTDFGLARLVSEVGPTVTGDFVGTLRYMSPEQALARRGLLDQRTDIYSLGVTLYELATLKPPFAGVDRAEVFRQIAFEEPSNPRRLDRTIPLDLETILLKAMSKEPAARYQTAQDLADDLNRFLEDQPVGARRPGPLQKVAKWCRRHRSVVTATVAMAIIGLAFSAWFFWRGQRLKEEETRRAETETDLARRALDHMYEQSQRWFRSEPWEAMDQWEFMRDAESFYEEFASKQPDTAAGRFRSAEAYHRLGQIRRLMHDFGPAQASVNEAIGRLKKLVEESPKKLEYRRELAGCYISQGDVLEWLGQFKQAEASFVMARSCLQELETTGRRGLKDVEQMANCEYGLGLVQAEFVRGDNSRFADADRAFLEAEKLFRELADKQRTNGEHANHLAALAVRRGKLFLDAGREHEAEPILRNAIEALKKLAADSMLLPDFRQELAAAHAALGEVLFKTGRPVPAEQAYRAAEAAYQKLLEAFPHVARYQGYLASTQEFLIEMLYQRHDLTGAKALAETAIHHCHVAIDASPWRGPLQESLQKLNNQLATVCIAQGDHVGAARAADQVANVVSFCPWGAQYAMELYALLPAVVDKDTRLSDSEKRDLIEKYLARRNQMQEEMLRRSGGSAAFLNVLAWHLGTSTDPRVRDVAQAVKYMEQVVASTPETSAAQSAMQLYAWLPAAVDKDSHLSNYEKRELIKKYLAREKQLQEEMLARSHASAEAHNDLAWYLVTCDELRIRDSARAIKHVEQAIRLEPNVWQYWNTLGVVRYRNGDWKGTITAMEKSSRMNGRTEPSDFLFLAMAYWHLEKREPARESFQKAVHLMDKDPRPNKERQQFRAEAEAVLGTMARERWAAAK